MSERHEVPDGVVMLQGRAYGTWPYVLNKAHEAGLCEIRSELIQIPSAANQNVAIVKATVVLRRGAEEVAFEAYGDASPANVKTNMIGAIIRLAETRAKGRAARDSVNVGECLLEELPEEESAPAQRRASPAPTARPTDMAAKHAPACQETGCERTLSANQIAICEKRVIELGGRLLCPEHLQQAAAEWKAAHPRCEAEGCAETLAENDVFLCQKYGEELNGRMLCGEHLTQAAREIKANVRPAVIA